MRPKIGSHRLALIVVALVVAMVATMSMTGAAAETSEVDTTPPETAITFPERNAVIQAGPFTMQGWWAADDLDIVVVAIRNRADQTWWWSPELGFRPGWPDPPGLVSDWEYDGDWWSVGVTEPPVLGPGRYVAYARAVDEAGNLDPTPAWVPFTVTDEPVPPETRIDSPSRNQAIPRCDGVYMTGHASDDESLFGVEVTIRDRANKMWWWSYDDTTSGFFRPAWPGPDNFIQVFPDPYGKYGDWYDDRDWVQWDAAYVPPGRYGAWARSVDVRGYSAGNVDPTPAWVPFTVTAPELDSTLVSPGDGSVVPAGEVTIDGSAQGNELGRVAIAIVNRTTRQWLQADGMTFGPGFVLHNADLEADDPAADRNGLYCAWWDASQQLPPGPYGMSVRAYDHNGVIETTRTWVRFDVEGSTTFFLGSSVADPNTGDSLSAADGIFAEGSAEASNRVARVRVAVRNQATREWLQPDGTFSPTFRLHDADHDDGGEQADWLWDFYGPLPPGEYGMSVRVIDKLGNVEEPSSRPWVTFTLT